jgi:uncharacterized protein YndB with AHSA1/START domain
MSTSATETEATLSDAPTGEVTETGDTLQVVFHRHLRAPIDKVWAALTTSERLADWFVEATVDLRVGGVLRFDGRGIADTAMLITICEPPRTFAWAWDIAGHRTIVRFDLAPAGDGCELTLTHSGLPRSAGGVRQGWHAHLEAIPDAIAGRATTWEAKCAREAALADRYPKLVA